MAEWKLPFPDKYITGEFGTRSKYRIANNFGPHRGTDWARPSGTKMPAINSGTIALVQYSSILGWCISHTAWAEGRTWYIGYSHLLEKPTLKVGDKIEVGETVGIIGSTGSASSGPHCHVTLSRSKKGVFYGKVYDIKKFVIKQNSSQEPPKPVKAVSTIKTRSRPPKRITKSPVPTKTYTVKSGDSYWKIGKAFGIDYRKLQKLNGSKMLHPGDRIKLS